MVILACSVLAGLAVLALAILWINQRKLIYNPDTRRVLPENIGLTGIQERILNCPDGVKVVAWYGKAPPHQPTLLYFHGNGGNLAVRGERIAAYRNSGRGIYMMSYRGYSGSSGVPTEENNISDALAAYDDLRELGVQPQDIILYGESLGSGIAVQVAAQRGVGGIILDAPFTTLADAGKHHYPYLPVDVALWDRYNSLDKIVSVKAPLLVVHGKRDNVVPFGQGQQLFAAANEPKEMVAIPQGGHSNHHLFGSFHAIQRWLDKVTALSPAE